MKVTTIGFTFISLLSCGSVAWAAATADEKAESRILDDNSYRNLVQNPLALSLGLLASGNTKGEKHTEQGTVIISSTANGDKYQQLKPAINVDNLGSLNLPNNFLPNYPQLPLLSTSSVLGLPTGSGATNTPIYTHRHEHYYNSPATINNELSNLRLNTLISLLRSLTSSPYLGLDRQSYLSNAGRSPSFIIINPAHFGPYIQSQYNRETPSPPFAAYAGLGRNSGTTINAVDAQENEKYADNAETDTLVDMKPIFMAGSELMGEDYENVWSQARLNPTGNPLLHLILEQNRRKPMHDDVATTYLRNYKTTATKTANSNNHNSNMK